MFVGSISFHEIISMQLKEMQKGFKIRLFGKHICKKNLTFAILIFIVFSLPYNCRAQDTLSRLEFQNSKGTYYVTIPQKHTKISIYETEPEYSTMEYVVEDTITFAKFAITHTVIPLPMFKIVPETDAYFFDSKKYIDTLKYAGKIHEYNKGNITRRRVTYWKLYTIVDYRNVQPENINTGFNGNIISVGYWNVRRIQKRKYDRMISTITFVEKQK